mmetsp:Transcript_21933/g.38899  ORF Transcript_21933/g.38899 Transcript_21933/m.38899 type:complete len:110 (-) Transcript_21933:1055-1384(-)
MCSYTLVHSHTHTHTHTMIDVVSISIYFCFVGSSLLNMRCCNLSLARAAATGNTPPNTNPKHNTADTNNAMNPMVPMRIFQAVLRIFNVSMSRYLFGASGDSSNGQGDG